MILSLLLVVFVVVVVRATWHCVAAGWKPGILLGLVRIGLMLASLFYAVRSWSIDVAPGGALTRGQATASLLLAAAQLLGPAVSGLVLLLAYLRCRDVPAKEEAAARRPFSAWMPAAVLDLVYLFIVLVAVAFSGFGPSE